TIVATATARSGATFTWDNGALPPGDSADNPQTATSDAAGVAEFLFDEGGGSLPSYPSQPDLDFAITSQAPGPPRPVPLSPCTPALQVLSYDLNADGQVNLTDFAVFATDYGAGNPRSDFNWSGNVDLTDFAAFASNYGASLDAQ